MSLTPPNSFNEPPSRDSDALSPLPPEPHSTADWLHTVSGVSPASQSVMFVDNAREPAPPTQPEYKAPRERRPLPQIPGYDILAELGRGGMGVVFKARHQGLDRLVALKMILGGELASPDALARFRAEAQVLAQLQHPHIVQVYDVGTLEDKTGTPRPFMALELVEGGSLSKQLRNRPQPPQEAAALIELLALAMHAAHEKGIIHRDLKPGNILLQKTEGRNGKTESAPKSDSLKVKPVTPSSAGFTSAAFGGHADTGFRNADFHPKITDFGLAKRLEGDSSQTRTGEIIGTPNYMAPEQAAGRNLELSPAVDVYALGAILYEMLTGRPPHHGVSPTDTVLQVLERDPLPPSYLQHELPRDLETICLKCLRREPHQRYASAADLAADLRRYLTGEPIRARPVGSWERGWRWMRRNPVPAGLSAALVILLLAGAAVTAYFAVLASDRAQQAEQNAALAWKQQARAEQNALQAQANEQRAKEEEEAARLASDFLTGIFQDSDPVAVGGRVFGALPRQADTLLARDVVDRGREQLETKLRDQPKLRALLLDKIGNVYLGLGDVDQAEVMLEEALALRRKILPPDHPELAASLQSLGFVLFLRHKTTESLALFRAALAIQEGHYGADHPATAESMVYLAMPLVRDAEYAEGEALLHRALAIRRRQPGDRRRALAVPLVILSYSLLKRGEAVQAMVPLSELMQIGDQLEIRGIGTVLKKGAQAKLMEKLNRRVAAQLWREAMAEAASALGKDHFVMTFLRSELIEILIQLQDGQALERELRVGLPLLRRFYDTNSHLVGNGLRNLAWSLYIQGKNDEAQSYVEEAIGILRTLPDADGRWRLAQAYYLSGHLALRRGDWSAAETAWRAELDLRRILHRQHRHGIDPLQLTYPFLEDVVFFQEKPARSWAVFLEGAHWWNEERTLPPLAAMLGVEAFAKIWESQGCFGAAAGLQAAMLPCWEKWRQARPDSPSLCAARPRQLLALARNLARSKDAMSAWSVILNAHALLRGTSQTFGVKRTMFHAVVLVEQACMLSCLARELEALAGELPSEAAALRQRCTEDALHLLRDAVQAGYDNPARLRTDPDLAYLRGHPSFQTLLRVCEAAAP